VEPPGRRLVARSVQGDARRKMLDELSKESPYAAGPYYRLRPQSVTWAFLGLLEDQEYRPKFKSILHVPDDFDGDDSSLVRILAVDWAIVEAAKEIDAICDELWRRADHERHMAQEKARLLAPTLGWEAEDDVIRHARRAQRYVLEARKYQNPSAFEVAQALAERLGRHLEPYFVSGKTSSTVDGWRPARLIAGLVKDMTGQDVTEPQVRAWCGWKKKPPAKRRPKQMQPRANRSVRK